MELTIKELISHLAQRGEEQVLELLNLTSQDILERFEDVVEERYDYLINELELLQEEDKE